VLRMTPPLTVILSAVQDDTIPGCHPEHSEGSVVHASSKPASRGLADLGGITRQSEICMCYSGRRRIMEMWGDYERDQSALYCGRAPWRKLTTPTTDI
jgi:hypothetical protein